MSESIERLNRTLAERDTPARRKMEEAGAGVNVRRHIEVDAADLAEACEPHKDADEKAGVLFQGAKRVVPGAKVTIYEADLKHVLGLGIAPSQSPAPAPAVQVSEGSPLPERTRPGKPPRAEG